MKLDVDFSALEACVRQMGTGLRNHDLEPTEKSGVRHDCLARTDVSTGQSVEPAVSVSEAFEAATDGHAGDTLDDQSGID